MYVTKTPLIQGFNTYFLLFQGKPKQYCIIILYSLSSAQQDYISCCLWLSEAGLHQLLSLPKRSSLGLVRSI